MDGAILAQTVISGVLWGLIYTLIALGLTLIFGVMDIVNFAHGDFLMVAMYLTYVLGLVGVNPYLGTPVVAAVMFLFGVLVYRTAIKRILDAPMLAQIFVTFGLLVFLRNLGQLIFSADFLSVANPVFQGRISLGGVFFNLPHVTAAVVAGVMTLAIYLFITKTETGWALMAVAENKQAASLVGINSDRMYALAWGIGTAAVGIAGALLANFYYVYPGVGATFGLLAYFVVALGGFGSIAGAFWGGVIIGLTEALAGFLINPSMKYLVVFLVYVVVLVFRPKGLMGSA